MGFLSRHFGVRIANGVGANARVNQAEEIVGIPWLYQMALEGRVFCAGTGLEEAGVTTATTLADTAATFALVAPASGTLVIPVRLTCYQDTEGDGANEIHLMYTQGDKSGFGGGTIMPAINALGGASPRAAQARFQSTVTLDAIVASEYVSLTHRIHIIDNWQTTETDAGNGIGCENYGPSIFEFSYDFLERKVPLVLTGESSISVHTNTATTGDTLNASMVWVELPADVYGL